LVAYSGPHENQGPGYNTDRLDWLCSPTVCGKGAWVWPLRARGTDPLRVRGTDPFGHNKDDPCDDTAGKFFVVLRILVRREEYLKHLYDSIVNPAQSYLIEINIDKPTIAAEPESELSYSDNNHS